MVAEVKKSEEKVDAKGAAPANDPKKTERIEQVNSRPVPPIADQLLDPQEEEKPVEINEAPEELKRPPMPKPKPSRQSMLDTYQTIDSMKKNVAKLTDLGVKLPKSIAKIVNEIWSDARSTLGME